MPASLCPILDRYTFDYTPVCICVYEHTYLKRADHKKSQSQRMILFCYKTVGVCKTSGKLRTRAEHFYLVDVEEILESNVVQILDQSTNCRLHIVTFCSILDDKLSAFQ